MQISLMTDEIFLAMLEERLFAIAHAVRYFELESLLATDS
jgi:hypothetical protein